MRLTDILNEARIQIGNMDVTILKNPVALNLAAFLGNSHFDHVRLSLINGDLYAWDAQDATHQEIMQYFGDDWHTNKHCYHLNKRREQYILDIPAHLVDEAIQNANVQRALARGKIHFLHPDDPGQLVTLDQYLNHGTLTEAVVQFAGRIRPTPYLKNPLASRLITMLEQTQYHELRGVLASDGNTYFWDASQGIHSTFLTNMGLNEDAHCYYLQKRTDRSQEVFYILDIRRDLLDEALANPNVLRALEGGRIHFRDHGWVLTTIAEYLQAQEEFHREFGDNLTEAMRVDLGTGEVFLHKNPGGSTLKALHSNSLRSELRGIMIGEDVYFWDAMKALHCDIYRHFGAPRSGQNYYFDIINYDDGQPVCYVLKCSGGPVAVRKMIKNHNVRRILKGDIQFVTPKGDLSTLAEFEGTTEGAQSLTEARVKLTTLWGESIAHREEDYVVNTLKNPKQAALISMFDALPPASMWAKSEELRCVVLSNGDIHFWAAAKAFHNDILRALDENTSTDCKGYVRLKNGRTTLTFYYASTLKKVYKLPAFKRLFEEGGEQLFIYDPVGDGTMSYEELERLAANW